MSVCSVPIGLINNTPFKPLVVSDDEYVRGYPHFECLIDGEDYDWIKKHPLVSSARILRWKNCSADLIKIALIKYDNNGDLSFIGCDCYWRSKGIAEYCITKICYEINFERIEQLWNMFSVAPYVSFPAFKQTHTTYAMDDSFCNIMTMWLKCMLQDKTIFLGTIDNVIDHQRAPKVRKQIAQSFVCFDNGNRVDVCVDDIIEVNKKDKRTVIGFQDYQKFVIGIFRSNKLSGDITLCVGDQIAAVVHNAGELFVKISELMIIQTTTEK